MLLSALGIALWVCVSLGRPTVTGGELSSQDIKEIKRIHRSYAAVPSLLHQRWMPKTIQRYFAGASNPIEEIHVVSHGFRPDGQPIVTVVYRGLETRYYDTGEKERRWGLDSYMLAKGFDGWHEAFIFP